MIILIYTSLPEWLLSRNSTKCNEFSGLRHKGMSFPLWVCPSAGHKKEDDDFYDGSREQRKLSEGFFVY
jgi:hypothetical protein